MPDYMEFVWKVFEILGMAVAVPAIGSVGVYVSGLLAMFFSMFFAYYKLQPIIDFYYGVTGVI